MIREKLDSRRLVVIWVAAIAILFGMIEAMAFYDRYSNGYHILMALFVMVLLLIIPVLSGRSNDYILIMGSAFLIQFLQDVGHWFGRAYFVGNWEFGDPLWTPIWDSLNISFPIPLFWIIDIFMFLGLYKYWRKTIDG